MTTPPFDWSLIDPTAWLGAVAGLAAGGGLLFWGRRRSRRWRTVLHVLGLLLLFRVILFENPLVWHAYARYLDPHRVGWRQYDVVCREWDSYLEPLPGGQVLAVGSSQTGRIYEKAAERDEELQTYVVAGMTPLDLYAYREDISRRQPETILLYVSELELCRPTPEGAIATAPRQGTDIFELLSIARRFPEMTGGTPTLMETLLGEMFPEAKYGFVLRGVVDELIWRGTQRWTDGSTSSEPVSREQRIGWLRDSFDENTLDFNLLLLQKALQSFVDAGIRIVVVEGRYNPDVLNDRLRELHARSTARLLELLDGFDGVRYLPSDTILQLRQESFADLTHLDHDVGQRFAQNVMRLLEGELVDTTFTPPVEATPRAMDWWQERYREQNQRLEETPDARVLFWGDSLTHLWEREGKTVWNRYYGGRQAVNLGISSDRTEHLLWRVQNASLDGLSPRVAIVFIGTNNISLRTHAAEDIAEGIEAVVDELHDRLPDTQILLLACWPRGQRDHTLRPKTSTVNESIAELGKLPYVRYLDLGLVMLDGAGNFSKALLAPDGLHLSEGGYERWASAMEPVLSEMLAGER